MKLSKRHLVFSLALAATCPLSALAQAFPSKPVRIILPYPAGTGPDTFMRVVGEKLSNWWGTPVIVDNRPGGNGWIAIEAVKRSPPDGYTLMQVDASQMTLHPHIYKKLPYDTFKDFDPVSPMYVTNYFVVVAGDSKWNSITDLVVDAKSTKGGMNYGSSGIGSQLHVGAAMFASAVDVPMTHIPIRNTPQIYVDIMRGDIAWAFGTASTTGELYKAKKVKYLALAAPQRNPNFPDIPTLREAGGPPDLEVRTWISLFAPAGTPKAIIDRINADVTRAMAEPDVSQRLDAAGFSAWSAQPAQLRKAMDDDYKLYGAVAKKVKISLD